MDITDNKGIQHVYKFRTVIINRVSPESYRCFNWQKLRCGKRKTLYVERFFNVLPIAVMSRENRGLLYILLQNEIIYIEFGSFQSSFINFLNGENLF